MKLCSDSFENKAVIPDEYAFCVPAKTGHVTLGKNRNPHLRWDMIPGGTKSFVLICHDVDTPAVGDDVNQEGKEVAANLPRTDFFHWILVDIPVGKTEISAGEYCDGVTARGKDGGRWEDGSREGINDYTKWFAADESMKGDYFGYDGPCPPWNDAIPHQYFFTVYALDVEILGVDGKFDGHRVRNAIAGHILAQAQISGFYTLNPQLR